MNRHLFDGKTPTDERRSRSPALALTLVDPLDISMEHFFRTSQRRRTSCE